MKEERKRIPLVVAFTANYFIPAATCLYSVLKNSESNCTFSVICLLAEDLPHAMREALAALDPVRLEVQFINLKGRLSDIHVDERYTVAASYRLLLADLLPELDRVIYIDCDTIVRNDIADLFLHTPLASYYLAAVFEATLDHQVGYLDALGVRTGQYFNSGFLLMNLDRMRREGMVSRFLEAAKNPDLQFPDQDVLNQICQGEVLGLPPYYNGIRTFFLPQYRPAFLRQYTSRDWDAVQKHGTIHYTGAKPWDTFTIRFREWWQYYDQLPTSIKRMGNVDTKIKYLYKVYSCAPVGNLIDCVQHSYRKWRYKIGG